MVFFFHSSLWDLCIDTYVYKYERVYILKMWAEAVGPCREGVIEARLGEEVAGGRIWSHPIFLAKHYILNIFLTYLFF